MSKYKVTALQSNPDYGVSLILCGNAEILSIDTTELPYRKDEAANMVIHAGASEAEKLGYEYSVDSVFANWSGGWLRRGQHHLLHSSKVAVRVFRRVVDDDGGSTWDYCTDPLPDHIVEEVGRLQTQVEDAMWEEILNLEELAESIAKEAATATND